MAHIPISVIVVSRNRPVWLKRCLRAIGQLDYPGFETIVVACPAGARVARELGIDRVCDCDVANISTARNIGVSAARGDVIAFIDDDAVPEPTWLGHLAEIFTDPQVMQAGGTTLGRNGLSLQHGAARVDVTGQSYRVAPTGPDPVAITPVGDQHPRLHGTNMALRRRIIQDHGGFDERFAFYLDETDLTFRISRQGGQTLFVPRAVVHHGSGPSDFRDGARTPRRVSEIAASAAVFHAKHCVQPARDQARQAFLADRRTWLLRHMQIGSLTPDDVTRLIRELHDGYAEGLTRTSPPEPEWASQYATIEAVHFGNQTDIYLVKRHRTDTKILNKAKTMVAQGHRVTVFDYRPDARYHCVAFTDDGYWLHTGGIFGREDRAEPLLQKSTRQKRIHRTLERLAGIRSKKWLLCGD